MVSIQNRQPILFYSKSEDYFELSNYYCSPMTIDGITYQSNEHYFQAQKFNYPEADKNTLEYFHLICQADSPQKTKDMGTQHINYRGSHWYINKDKKELGLMNNVIQQYKHLAKINPNWDTVRMEVMRKGLTAKFTQNPQLLKLLLETGPRYLIEDSPRDSFWGAAKNGQNHLGKLLVELRAKLANQ